ncbi:hypothetical protein PVNG_06534 [Plasmodium vivax North Korean]|nr:hypothetical protein PVNG_06534 [Plasmodium vivax North Korean]
MPEKLFFKLSKRKAFILYFYHGIYLERKYYVMVDYMNKWFFNLARTNHLPEEYRLVWWDECLMELLYDLECLQRTCENFFRTFVGKRRKKIWTMPFENLLNRFYRMTLKSAVRNKDKWIRILTQRVRSYQARAHRKQITHRR